MAIFVGGENDSRTFSPLTQVMLLWNVYDDPNNAYARCV